MSLDSHSTTASTVSAYVRIASISIALYDYLETQPTAWRFYREQWRIRKLSTSTVLFVLIRFVSILVLTLSNVGFFYNGFTNQTCHRFFLLPPAFKVMQAMVSQAILGTRAFNLARRSFGIGCFLLLVYLISCVLQWITTLYQRSPRVGDALEHGNCRAFNTNTHLGAWIYYAIAIIYDVLVTAMSVRYLLRYKFNTTNSMISKLTRMMLYDGLGYLVVLTAVNVLNLILYKTSQDIQNAAASLGYCVSWIMSQRLLIHLHDARERHNEGTSIFTGSHNLGSSHAISNAFGAQVERKTGTAFELTRPDFDLETVTRDANVSEVHVIVERVVKHERRPRTYELEDYSRGGRSREACSK